MTGSEKVQLGTKIRAEFKEKLKARDLTIQDQLDEMMEMYFGGGGESEVVLAQMLKQRKEDLSRAQSKAARGYKLRREAAEIIEEAEEEKQEALEAIERIEEQLSEIEDAVDDYDESIEKLAEEMEDNPTYRVLPESGKVKRIAREHGCTPDAVISDLQEITGYDDERFEPANENVAHMGGGLI